MMKITPKTLEIMPNGYHKGVRHYKAPVCTGKNRWAWRPKRSFVEKKGNQAPHTETTWAEIIATGTARSRA